MGQPKDATNKPGRKRPARTSEKSHASPDDNQFYIDLCRHLNFPFRDVPFQLRDLTAAGMQPTGIALSIKKGRVGKE